MLPPIEFSTGRMPCVARPVATAANTSSKASHGDEVGVVAEAKGRRLAVGARLSLIGYAHGHFAPGLLVASAAGPPEGPAGSGTLHDRVR